MMRAWVGVALLSTSWLLGLDYYSPASPIAWVTVVGLASVMLSGVLRRETARAEAWVVVAILVPVVWLIPWPYRMAPLLIILGLALEQLPIPGRWSKPLGRGGVLAGVVMLVQSVVLATYTSHTARSHELPWPLPDMLGAVAHLLGMEATADGSTVVLHSFRQVHRLAATWELLVDPVSLGFFAGGLVVLAAGAWSWRPDGGRWSGWIAGARTVAMLTLLWLPVRAGLLMALYLHRVLRADVDLPLHVMNALISPWVHLLLVGGLVLLVWQFVRVGNGESGETPEQDRAIGLGEGRWRRLAGAGTLVLVGAGLMATAVYFCPVGERQAGRVMVVERHSAWEPTDKPYNTEWFGHDSGYNYGAAYAYCAQYYQMSRLLETERIDDRKLAECDVLVIKIPTARYSKQEVDAVERFVESGGGLLLIGDHTNFERSSTYLNDITRRFGFTYRHDLLFTNGDSPYEQTYCQPWAPHPAVQHLPRADMAVSCSIDPGRSRGRAVIQSTGLWSLGPEYHIGNFHPLAQHQPEMQYGGFVQAWAAGHGEGRVLAFTDSTVFSNFCVFQPGKAEMLVGLLEWLNHRHAGDPRLGLAVVGLVVLGAGLWLARGRLDHWLVLLSAGTCGWVLASAAVAQSGRCSMPWPEAVRPLPRVVIDRTTSQVPLSKGAYREGQGEGYGMLEQWIARLGCYTVRENGPAAFSGDVLVVICPNRSVSRPYREALVRYVREGGRLLVFDSPDDAGSTANSLVEPFGLSIQHGQPWQGVLTMVGGWPGLRIDNACAVEGGLPVGRLDKLPIAAQVRYGEGAVTAVGFASALTDAKMSEPRVEDSPWMTDPDDAMLQRYDTLFALVRAVLDNQPIRVPPARKPAAKAPAKEDAPSQP